MSSGMNHKQTMASTKRIFEEMKQCEQTATAPSTEMISSWRSVVRTANAELVRMSRQLACVNEMHRVQMCILLEEMQKELVDREANVARTAERYRVLQDRSASTGITYERAVSSASVVESAIAQICPHALSRNAGSVLLYEKEHIVASRTNNA